MAVEFLKEPWVRDLVKCLWAIQVDYINHVFLVHMLDSFKASQQICEVLLAFIQGHALQYSVYAYTHSFRFFCVISINLTPCKCYINGSVVPPECLLEPFLKIDVVLAASCFLLLLLNSQLRGYTQ